MLSVVLPSILFLCVFACGHSTDNRKERFIWETGSSSGGVWFWSTGGEGTTGAEKFNSQWGSKCPQGTFCVFVFVCSCTLTFVKLLALNIPLCNDYELVTLLKAETYNILCPAACVGWAGCLAQSLDAPWQRGAGSCRGAARSSPPLHGPTDAAAAALPNRSADGRAPHRLPQQGRTCWNSKPTQMYCMQGRCITCWRNAAKTAFFFFSICLSLRSLPVLKSWKTFCAAPPAG